MNNNYSFQRQSFARLSFSQSITTPAEIYKGIRQVAFTSFGNQHSQIQRFHTKFVRQYKWLSQSQFKQIVNLCWALPGPTVLQIIITMTTLKTKSPLAGFIAFIIFNIPSWLILFILGWFSQEYLIEDMHLPTQLKLMFLGFNSSAAGVLVRSFSQTLLQHYKRPEKLFIMLASTTIFLIFRSTNSITFCLMMGAIISLYTQIQTKKKMSSKSAALMQNSKLSWIFGKNALILLGCIYVIFWFYFSFFQGGVQYLYIYIDYFVGVFIIGPLSTIFAYFYANFLQNGLMSQDQFWVGVPLAFMFPGSIINVGIYFGAVIDGFRGAILSAIFLYLPCFLSLYGILPEWRYYRDKPGIQRLIIGITCVTNGFGLSIIILALQYCIRVDLSTTICIFIVSVFLNYVWGFYSVVTIIIGGLLANTRRWGLIYYRFLPDHQY